ncbi:MAG: hypothetical protein F6K18_27465 [Okeania sp. SIO2C2]|uniref:ISAzo13-like element transposase-related protein n=1 Tax=Okeania sp. SIO2C2 TaxID=2607787 RepID=UPI0013B77A24|nr:hypothetical protein [Okeania sp. SIO2C2]NEP90266.1 hypothetical protein [Okeania sp. SIO2C2]
MNPYSEKVEQQMKKLYNSLSEKDRRRYAGIEALKLGWGGISYINLLFRCDYYTIPLGIDELDDSSAMSMSKVRRSGGGGKSAISSIEGLDEAFFKVIAEHTAGSPTNEQLKWTNLTRQEISQLLKEEGITVSVTVVDQLLTKHNYRQGQAQKRITIDEHPQRNQQFENTAQPQVS